MSSGEITYVTVGPVSAIPPGMGRAYHVGPHRIAVFRTRSGRVFATAQRCPHRGGPLADGMLVGEQVVCPLHAFRFDLQTGQCEQSQVCPVPTYPVDITPDGWIRIGIPARFPSSEDVSPLLTSC
ncbi:MAG: Rieske 2Fe-2S domain-containing protein [Thermogemmata sp.]